MIAEGSLVVVSLQSPREQCWGVLQSITPMGVTLRCLSLGSFDEWARELARGDERSTDLVATFLPMHRVERVILDEDMGVVESFSSRFLRVVGKTIAEHLAECGDAESSTEGASS